jgi:hypothetical protein
MFVGKLASHEHEIGAHFTALHTFHHECDVFWINVLSSLSKAVRDAGKALAVTGQAVFDTFFHAEPRDRL